MFRYLNDPNFNVTLSYYNTYINRSSIEEFRNALSKQKIRPRDQSRNHFLGLTLVRIIDLNNQLSLYGNPTYLDRKDGRYDEDYFLFSIDGSIQHQWYPDHPFDPLLHHQPRFYE